MKTARTLASAVAALALAGAVISAPNDQIRREGSGKHRQQLDAMELKPFPAEAISGLTDWVNGTAPTADAMKGKVVLFVTWSSWYRTSHAALSQAEDLYKAHAGDGLMVIGVHHPKGWEGAADVIAKRKITFPCAHDAGGTFRSTLDTDGDPDFYVVDRAGNLRFADIVTSSVEDAVNTALAETPEQAAALPGKLADKQAQAKEDANRTKKVAGGLKPGETLNVPFQMPPDSAYNGVDWPEHNTHQLSADNYQGKPLPQPLGSETYLDGKPNTKGRIVVLDFWATWCGPCRMAMPRLDDMYKKNRSDIVVIGISNENTGKVRDFIHANKHSYPQAIDAKDTVAGALKIRGIPHVVVLSTDGVIRWQGNPLNTDELRKAVQKCIKVDPGVQARKKAEEEYLRSLSG